MGAAPRVDNAMVKALAGASRWRKMIDTGVHATLEDLAQGKGVVPSYVSRVLRLTLLAPEIVEAILDGWQPEGIGLRACWRGFRWNGTCSGLLDLSWHIPPVLTGGAEPFRPIHRQPRFGPGLARQ